MAPVQNPWQHTASLFCNGGLKLGCHETHREVITDRSYLQAVRLTEVACATPGEGLPDNAYAFVTPALEASGSYTLTAEWQDARPDATQSHAPAPMRSPAASLSVAPGPAVDAEVRVTADCSALCMCMHADRTDASWHLRGEPTCVTCSTSCTYCLGAYGRTANARMSPKDMLKSATISCWQKTVIVKTTATAGAA